ncbi:MAG: IS1595 family transposase [Boseongicola sp. SB0673_bin_14]|nr:IS1595 family transposase [Boseongicola sp. SB0673_bin_14]
MGNSPGKSFREGLSFMEVADMFSDEDKAREWIAENRWPDGPYCPKCGSFNVQSNIKHKSMTHRCRDCYNGKSRTMFSIKTGTVMEGSNLKYRAWAIGIYMFMTNIKGVSSTHLRRELKCSQKAAWFMMHRLRKVFETDAGPFSGPVEVDESFFGGKVRNMSNAKRRERKKAGLAQGPSGKTVVVGMKDRESGKVTAKVVQKTDAGTLQGFIADHVDEDAKVYTDEAKAYKGMPFDHEAVNHSVSEYVREQAHTNGIESHWAMMKRSHEGIYHKMSPKHLQRYCDEFSGRHGLRNQDTIDQMKGTVAGMVGKRLLYRELVADNGLSNGLASDKKTG